MCLQVSVLYVSGCRGPYKYGAFASNISQLPFNFFLILAKFNVAVDKKKKLDYQGTVTIPTELQLAAGSKTFLR